MRSAIYLLLSSGILLAGLAGSVQGQLTPGGPTGDFRTQPPHEATPIPPPSSAPGLSPGPMTLQDMVGGLSPAEVLKRLDKDLGRSTLESPGARDSHVDFERELRSPADRFK